jgi:hypothetical protein
MGESDGPDVSGALFRDIFKDKMLDVRMDKEKSYIERNEIY